MKIDLHAHTIYSDGADTPEMVVARAKAVGLSGIAITDHNTIAGIDRAKSAAKRIGLLLVPGKEVSIMQEGRRVGEILCLFLEEDTKKDLYHVSKVTELLDEIKDQDAISSVPHPFDYFPTRAYTLINLLEKKNRKTDAIEVMNGRCSAASNALGFEYALKNNLGQTAGSDAHHMQEIGHCYTFCEAGDLEEFRKMIKKKQSKAIGMQKSATAILYHRLMARTSRLFGELKRK
jgi:hypothetical protein